jgi:hypothetical protein
MRFQFFPLGKLGARFAADRVSFLWQ